jgi:hypothetical protein
MLARLAPHEFSLASPQAVRGAICRHFAPSFVLHAVEGLASRKPEQSARTPLVLWQRLVFSLVPLVVLTSLALWPAATVWGVTASLGVLFVPLIGFRLLAAYGLLASASGGQEASCPRLPDRVLPVYTLLVPLYREANMLPGLARALSRLDYPAAKLDIKIILEASDRDHLRGASAPASRHVRTCRRPGACAAHQAEGAELCPAAGARRLYCDLRCRGSPRARAAPKR